MAKHGPESRGVSQHRTDLHGGNGVARRARSSSAWACSTATATRASAWPRRTSPTSSRFGFDAPPFTYADFEESDVLVFVGANPCIAHPIMWQRVMRNRQPARRSSSSIRARPRRRWRRRSIYALAPKSDLTLLYGLANLLIASGWIDREFIDAHTTGFEEFAEFVTQLHAGHGRARRPA